MKAQTVTIVGLGRIGASIGLALKQSPLDIKLVGHDSERARAKEAQEQGAIDAVEWQLMAAVAKADILVLSLPVAELEETLRLIGRDVQAHALVLNVSRLKAQAQKWADRYLQQGHYIGAMPVLAAGNLGDGDQWGPPQPNLFRDSVICLMPSPKADPQAVDTAVNLGVVLGATPYFLDAAEYDSLVTGVETVPALMSAALFNAVHKANGWRDILRFAGANFALTTQPLQQGEEAAHLAFADKAATLRWLDALIAELREVRRWVYEGEPETLMALLQNLYVEREKWLQERAENNWVEVQTPNVEMPNLSQQLFGGLAGRRNRDE